MTPVEAGFRRIADLLDASGTTVEILSRRQAKDLLHRWRGEFGEILSRFHSDWRHASVEPGRHVRAGADAEQLFEQIGSTDFAIGSTRSDLILRCHAESGQLPPVGDFKRLLKDSDFMWEVFVCDADMSWTFVFLDMPDDPGWCTYLAAINPEKGESS